MKTIQFKSSYNKVVVATIDDRSGDVDILNIEINGTYYSKKQCAKHQWLLYLAIKNYLYE